jgi:Protein of unknown function (Hypoth_ymh)
MNRDDAHGLLSNYVAAVEQAESQGWGKLRQASLKGINECMDLINDAFRHLAPDIGEVKGSSLSDHLRTLPRVRSALDLLTQWQRLVGTGQKNDVVPAMVPIAMMDPLVRLAAVPLWKAGKSRLAVNDAATALNAFAQDRLGRRDISDSDLMAQAFSPSEPQKDQPRLRCPGDHRSMTVRSQQRGALLMSQGVFQAIRNPAAHSTGDWNPITAAEHLAALSIVARWVRYWDVVKYVMTPQDLSAIVADSTKAITHD